MNLPDFLTRSSDGEIVVTGHRIGLFSIVDRYQQGLSAEQIHEEFPTIEVDCIRRTLAFYADHRGEVDEYVSGYRVELERQEAETEPSAAQIEVRRVIAQSAANRQPRSAS